MELRIPAAIILVSICLSIFAGCLTQPRSIAIGVMPFNEQYILGEMIARLVEKEGLRPEIISGLNNDALFESVKTGQIDIYVDYTSSIYYRLPDRGPIDRWDPDEVFRTVEQELEAQGIKLAGRVGFRNDNIIVVPTQWARERNVSLVSDLANYAGDMIFGSDLVFHAAEEDGLPHIEKVYQFRFKEVRPMDPSLTFQALQSGKVDAIVAYSTDARIELFNLTALEDDRFALPPYHAIILVNAETAKDPGIERALAPLVDGIDSATMRELNLRFDLNKEDPAVIAREFLIQRGLIHA